MSVLRRLADEPVERPTQSRLSELQPVDPLDHNPTPNNSI